MKKIFAMFVFAMAMTAMVSFAQEAGGKGKGEGKRQMPPPSPVVTALDADGNGIIDEKEIAASAEALKKLDKNGDGKLTPDELRPPRPEGDRPGRGGKKKAEGAEAPAPAGE
jgi:hypothetical protein